MTEPNVNLSEALNSTSLGLLERAKAGDQSAWGRMVSLYTPLIEHWLGKAGLQEADAADVRQDVFVAVTLNIAEFQHDREGDTFRGWLYRITQNKLRDHWRKQRGGLAPAGLLEEANLPAPADSSSAAPAEDKHILYRRALDLIRRDFEEHSWQAFWRVVIDGQTPKAAAAELRMTTNAVYLAKGRVLARLRDEFADAIED